MRARTALRIARHTDRLTEVVAFYRDGLGLTDVGGFCGHDGYDGAFLEVKGTGAHLEFTAAGPHRAPAPHPETLLVLYLGSEGAVERTLRRLGVAPLAPANPYWARHGVTVADPDGFRVVLVPERWSPAADGSVRIVEHAGPRTELRWLFELAEDSPQRLDESIDAGRLLVAVHDHRPVGHLQLTETEGTATLEVKNLAVAPPWQGRGIGRTLIAAAVEVARGGDRAALVVATAAAAVGNLAFYQRLGFRMAAVERDAFTAATGYPAGLRIDGIELRDRVWLDRPVEGPGE